MAGGGNPIYQSSMTAYRRMAQVPIDVNKPKLGAPGPDFRTWEGLPVYPLIHDGETRSLPALR